MSKLEYCRCPFDQKEFDCTIHPGALIDAAPELLQSLKRILAADDQLADEGDAEGMSSAIRAAHAAIARAEGRS